MKLVRDRIPEIIEASGQTCKYHIAHHTEHKERLFDKLTEELVEFIEEPCLEEAADLLEVLHKIFEVHDLDLRDVAQAAATKGDERGRFELGVILEKVNGAW